MTEAMSAAELALWLLVQLEADEASEWPHRPSCQMLKPAPEGWPLSSTFSCNCDAATHWMLDIEAKRQVIDHLMTELADDDTDQAALWMLTILGLTYARRPGYQEAWRP
jgi:Family of unknown function (DUF6221)